MKKVLLSSKVPSSSLPLENENDVASRFATLSSLVNHRAKTAYLPLPKCAKANSPSSLRDEEKSSVSAVTNEHSKRSISGKVDAFNKSTSGFYDSDGKWLYLISSFRCELRILIDYIPKAIMAMMMRTRTKTPSLTTRMRMGKVTRATGPRMILRMEQATAMIPRVQTLKIRVRGEKSMRRLELRITVTV